MSVLQITIWLYMRVMNPFYGLSGLDVFLGNGHESHVGSLTGKISICVLCLASGIKVFEDGLYGNKKGNG